MNTIKTMIWLFVFALGLGISVLSLPQTANAQTDKDKKESRQEKEDDDNDCDDDISAEDKQNVKVSMDEARTIALKRINGKIIDEELRARYYRQLRTTRPMMMS